MGGPSGMGTIKESEIRENWVSGLLEGSGLPRSPAVRAVWPYGPCGRFRDRSSVRIRMDNDGQVWVVAHRLLVLGLSNHQTTQLPLHLTA